MGHELFLKIFDGPESGFEQFDQTGHQEDLRKIRHVKQ